MAFTAVSFQNAGLKLGAGACSPSSNHLYAKYNCNLFQRVDSRLFPKV